MVSTLKLLTLLCLALGTPNAEILKGNQDRSLETNNFVRIVLKPDSEKRIVRDTLLRQSKMSFRAIPLDHGSSVSKSSSQTPKSQRFEESPDQKIAIEDFMMNAVKALLANPPLQQQALSFARL